MIPSNALLFTLLQATIASSSLIPPLIPPALYLLDCTSESGEEYQQFAWYQFGLVGSAFGQQPDQVATIVEGKDNFITSGSACDPFQSHTNGPAAACITIDENSSNKDVGDNVGQASDNTGGVYPCHRGDDRVLYTSPKGDKCKVNACCVQSGNDA